MSFLQLLKIVFILTLMALFIVCSAVTSLFFSGSLLRSHWRMTLGTFFARWSASVLGLEVEQKGVIPTRHSNYLIVSNHLSYIDVLAMISVLNTRFVTSMEVKHTAGLGWITDQAGCLYVERRSRKNLKTEIDEISKALECGFNVVVFPEATSTNGEGVLRFKRPLFNSAIATRTPVLPMVINYHSVDGEPVHKGNRDNVFWYGNMDFLPHLWRFTRYSCSRMSLEYLEPIVTYASMSVDELSAEAHKKVVEKFCPVTDVR